MSNPRPSLLRILQVDMPCFLATLFLVVFWGFFIFEIFTQGNDMSTLYGPLLAVSVAALLILGWRISFIYSLFLNGSETCAVIHQVNLWGDRVTLYYVYHVRGQKIMNSSTIMRTRRTMTITDGDEITVLYDPDYPKRSLIRDLYS